MADFITEIEQLRKMRNIERLSSTFKNRSYSLAEHSFFVGTFFIKLANEENISLSSNEIYTALTHDYMETYTGDLISTAKNFNDDTSSFWRATEIIIAENYKADRYVEEGIKCILGDNSRKYNLFKVCDLLDLYLFCLEEKDLGNNTKGINRVYTQVRAEIQKLCLDNDFNYILKLMDYFKLEK